MRVSMRWAMAPILLGVVSLLAGAGCGADPSPGSVSRAQLARSAEAPDLGEMAGEVQKHVAKVWPRTTRIWPGVDYSDHVLVLTDGKDAWQIDAKGHRRIPMSALEKHKVEVPQPGGFDTPIWDGRPAALIRAPDEKEIAEFAKDPTHMTSTDPALEVFELATHEQFHTFVQQDKAKRSKPWASLDKFEDGEGDRNEVYPVQAEPRMSRTMVYNSLLAALKEPDRKDEQLRAAAYWQQHWATKYPKEAKDQQQTELLEGTAKYFEKAAVGMAQADDPESKAQRLDYLAETLQPMTVSSKALEPYVVGASALLVADRAGLDFGSKLTTEPITPSSLVLDGVRPERQEMPEDVENGIKTQIDKTNKKIGPPITSWVDGVQDKKKLLLLAPIDAVVGANVTGLGFYTTKEMPTTILPGGSAAFKLKSGRLQYVKTTMGLAPHGEETYWAVPLDPADPKVRLDGNKLRVDLPDINGAFTVQQTTEDGQRILIAR